MKRHVVMILMGLFLGINAGAEERVMLACEPFLPTDLFESVTVLRIDNAGYEMEILRKDTNGNDLVTRAPAEYFDDITFFGYAADELEAAVRVDSPTEEWSVDVFSWRQQVIQVSCQGVQMSGSL